jgi:hypothetical protein
MHTELFSLSRACCPPAGVCVYFPLPSQPDVMSKEGNRGAAR